VLDFRSNTLLFGILLYERRYEDQLDVDEDEAISMFKDMFQHSVGSSYQSSMNRTTIALDDKIIEEINFKVNKLYFK
jgi:hypothetical protein